MTRLANKRKNAVRDRLHEKVSKERGSAEGCNSLGSFWDPKGNEPGGLRLTQPVFRPDG